MGIKTGVVASVVIAASGSLLAVGRVDRRIKRDVWHADPAWCICCAQLSVQLERDFLARTRSTKAFLLSTATLRGMCHRFRRT
ncbi:hypothetical protein ACE15N_02005 [Xanthomonas campestris pv. passiflorae]